MIDLMVYLFILIQRLYGHAEYQARYMPTSFAITPGLHYFEKRIVS